MLRSVRVDNLAFESDMAADKEKCEPKTESFSTCVPVEMADGIFGADRKFVAFQKVRDKLVKFCSRGRRNIYRVRKLGKSCQICVEFMGLFSNLFIHFEVNLGSLGHGSSG